MSTTSPEDNLEMLYAMQIRCGDRKLVLPRNAIIELKPFTEPEPLQSPQTRKLITAEPWILGSVMYRNLPVPVLSLEMLIDGASEIERRRCRVCILHGIGNALLPPMYAVICQGFPSLLEIPGKLNENVADQIAPENPDADNPYIAAQIQLGGYLCAVPNLPNIEQALAQAINDAKDD